MRRIETLQEVGVAGSIEWARRPVHSSGFISVGHLIVFFGSKASIFPLNDSSIDISPPELTENILHYRRRVAPALRVRPEREKTLRPWRTQLTDYSLTLHNITRALSTLITPITPCIIVDFPSKTVGFILPSFLKWRTPKGGRIGTTGKSSVSQRGIASECGMKPLSLGYST